MQSNGIYDIMSASGKEADNSFSCAINGQIKLEKQENSSKGVNLWV